MRSRTLMWFCAGMLSACQIRQNPAWDGPADGAGTEGPSVAASTGEVGTRGNVTAGADTGAASTDGETGNPGPASTGEPNCEQLDAELNDHELDAAFGPPLHCTGKDVTLHGTLAGLADSDWFELGPVNCGSNEGTYVRVNGAEDMEVCAYFECDEGTATAPKCSDEAVVATSPEGRPGCCATKKLELEVTCEDAESAVTSWWVRAEGLEPLVCMDYQLDARAEPLDD